MAAPAAAVVGTQTDRLNLVAREQRI